MIPVIDSWVHYRCLSKHGARCTTEWVEFTAKLRKDVTCPVCLSIVSEKRARAQKSDAPALTIIHVLLDHERRLRTIEMKLGIKIETPDHIRILQAKMR